MENVNRMQAWRLKMVESQWEKEMKVTKTAAQEIAENSHAVWEGTLDSKTRKSLKNQGHSAGEELTHLLLGLLITELK